MEVSATRSSHAMAAAALVGGRALDALLEFRGLIWGLGLSGSGLRGLIRGFGFRVETEHDVLLGLGG